MTMDVTELILALDTHLFLIINGYHSTYFDKFMFLFSEKLVWIPFYLSVIFALYRAKRKESIWLIIALIICVVLTDQISSSLIKDLVQRLRPSQEKGLEDFIHIVNGYKGGRYGFVSSHAANAFGFALLSSLFFRNRLYSFIVFFWAIITSYSRIYLGVHYPADILGGMIVGILVAMFCFGVVNKYRNQIFKSVNTSNNPVLILPSLVLVISFLGIALYSLVF